MSLWLVLYLSHYLLNRLKKSAITMSLPGVSISFLVSGWFCEVGSCGKKGEVREFKKISNIQEGGEHTGKGLLDTLVVLLNENKLK